jgi:putative tryptophan/tyrosine transport system substrate-binding protein
MTYHIRRREFITLLGGAAAAWPLAGAAQRRMPVIGILDTATGELYVSRLGAVRKGLNEIGFIEGQNVLIDARAAQSGNNDHLTALALELVRREVSVIVALGLPMALAAKKATATIPIVFETGDDPVAVGLVSAINRPGGNVTGISLLSPEMAIKRLAFLRELVPKASLIGVLVNTTNPSNERQLRELEAAALSLKVQLFSVRATSANDIDIAFEKFVQQGIGALLVGSDPLFFSRRAQLVVLAARHAIPTSYPDRDFCIAGGLMSYAANRMAGVVQTGNYAGRILKGEKPVDLPVLLPVKFEFVINMQTAKTLGLTVPLTLQVAADEVIE